MDQFIFEPIGVNSNAPGGACILRTFDDVGAFILNNVDTKQDAGYQYYTSYYEYYSPDRAEKGRSKPRVEPVKIPAARSSSRPGQIAEY